MNHGREVSRRRDSTQTRVCTTSYWKSGLRFGRQSVQFLYIISMVKMFALTILSGETFFQCNTLKNDGLWLLVHCLLHAYEYRALGVWDVFFLSDFLLIVIHFFFLWLFADHTGKWRLARGEFDQRQEPPGITLSKGFFLYLLLSTC